MPERERRGREYRDGRGSQAPEQRVTAWPKLVTLLLFLVIVVVVAYMLLVHPSGGADNAAVGPR